MASKPLKVYYLFNRRQWMWCQCYI